MTVPPFHVPTIDVSPYLEPGASAAGSAACARVAAALDTACRDVGFVQVVGHGVDPSVTDCLGEALDAFFDRPLEVKKRDRREVGVNRGYTPPKSESVSMSLGVASANMMNDFYEAFTVGTETRDHPEHDLPERSYPANTWPDDVDGFEPAVRAYFDAARDLSRTLLRIATDALGLPEDHFDALVDHSIDALKMNHYTLPEQEIEIAGDLVGMGAHTDFGILTVLWADQVPGLQVLGEDRVWHPVEPADGALLINLGDAMARWTNDVWKSTLHRVDPPVVDGRIIRRRSAAFFFDGNHDAVIEPLPGCVEPGQEAYPPITVAQNIAAKLAGMKTGAAPTTDLREAARVLAAG